MGDFLKFFDTVIGREPMHLRISYSKITDYTVQIWKKGCAENGGDIVICDVQDCDLSYCLAKAEVLLKEWLIRARGGY